MTRRKPTAGGTNVGNPYLAVRVNLQASDRKFRCGVGNRNIESVSVTPTQHGDGLLMRLHLRLLL